MINYNRLGYEIKRDLAVFSQKISKDLKRPIGYVAPHGARPLKPLMAERRVKLYRG